MPDFPTIEFRDRSVPPKWAVMERFLFDLMNRVAPQYVARYTRDDGTLVWRDEWVGMDGSDDGYESFRSFPLFYLIGGSEEVHELARRQWNAVTWQFTQYGQVHREFDAYYDWMHHGESSTYIYDFGLANPHRHQDRERALRFAAMYMGEDPDAQNWDAERRMIRSPINGSKGPQFHMTELDWRTHRHVLAGYLTPYMDVPGVDPSDPFFKVDWENVAAFDEVLKRMNERMVPGDVPLNLNATSLITNAFLYTGDEKYRTWVLDYLSAWEERTAHNDGIMPDNIGPNAVIGENMDGKWWGGYYGWRWPHGATIILESTLIAGANAYLLTGDDKWLDLHRSQLDMLWELGREEDGVFKVPNRYDDGWFDYRPPNPRYEIHLHYLTQSEQDLERLNRYQDQESWSDRGRFGKGGQFSPLSWYAYARGGRADAADYALDATYEEIARRLTKMRNDDGDPNDWDVHHWQDINPVMCEAMVQLAMGTPGAIYHGGLLHARLRYFDPELKRAGLPEHVAALVDRVEPDATTVTLVNTDAVSSHDVLVQAGSFAEHAFTEAEVLNATGDMPDEVPVGENCVTVRLRPSAQARLRLKMERYVNTPTYEFPWKR
ncbi:MAG: hypothetical protein O3A46_13370 [Candidatus Poribacteria bacterium]|nr:hypothetical protein [Candidatus Poribacteria bacterium]